MTTYFTNQEFPDMPWATPVPITLMLGGKLATIRVRGVCSVTVTDAIILEEKALDNDLMLLQVRNLLANHVTDIVAEISGEVSSAAQLTTMNERVLKALKTKVEPIFNTLGLKTKKLEIYAIEGK